MSNSDEITDRLDRLIALFSIAFSEQIEKTLEDIRSDNVASLIMETVGDEWVSSGEVKRSVSQMASVSEKTVQRSIASLCSKGVIQANGHGSSRKYRSGGIV